MWRLFAPHHYLTGSINKSARCYAMFVDGEPAAFSSVIAHMGRKGTWRGHRIVCLPDYQGVGIGMRITEHTASVVAGMGMEYRVTTTHPALMHAWARSPKWKVAHWPTIMDAFKQHDFAGRETDAHRLQASFVYVGPTLDRDTAQAFWR